MGRWWTAAVLVIAVALAAPSPAAATQCAALIHSVYAAAATRFDPSAYDARAKAAEAARLHREGHHDDAVRLACEGRELLGLRSIPACAQPTR
jgi:hypothetical protein